MPSSNEDIDDPAYLVIRQGGRWSDVFRLSPREPVVIGRSSQCQIVIRSDQCSRHHAKIAWKDGGWCVEDLDSRNGTFVDNQAISGSHLLQFGQTVAVAGYQMTLVSKVADAFSISAGATGNAANSAGQQVAGSQGLAADASSQTLEQIDPGIITERRKRSSFLEPTGAIDSSGAATKLFRTAFSLARATSPEEAATTALSTLREAAAVASGAVLVILKPKSAAGGVPATASGMTALATSSRSGRSYRRLPDRIATAVLASGEAVLARNIVDDLTLASPDSRGEMSTTSTLCAPLVVAGKTVGLLHLYSTDDEPELTAEQLEFAMAIAANLGLALEHLWRQNQLASKLKRTQAQVDQLRQQLGDRVNIVGDSEAIATIEQQVARAAPTNATVLIRGESGVGKELIAAAIHYASPRKDGPFVCLNCAALSPSLLESELFGHEKGAFTGATERKVGKFEAADGGTLMLDEIGEMSPEIQAKFLRVLEGMAFERVGGNVPIRADVRVVAATNRDLELAVREGNFRSDLFFRLHVLELRVPPLRERGHDILLLADHFLQRFSSETGRRLGGFTEAAKEKLLHYRWPGNIRELKNTIERAVVLCAGPNVEAEDILLSQLHLPGEVDVSPQSNSASIMSSGTPTTLADLERQHIDFVLRYTDGNKSQAAKLLGIERSTLDRKLKRFESD